MRGEEVQPTGRITARIACYQHAVDWDEIDPRLERRLSAVEKRYLAKRMGQNRVAAGKPRDSHNPGQIYCEESFGEDEATEKTPWNKARASASKPETSASSSGDDHSLLMQLMAKIETLEASQQSLVREPRTGAHPPVPGRGRRREGPERGLSLGYAATEG